MMDIYFGIVLFWLCIRATILSCLGIILETMFFHVGHLLSDNWSS